MSGLPIALILMILSFASTSEAQPMSCGGFALSDCRLAARFRNRPERFDRFTLNCTVTADVADAVDFVTNGLTVVLGNDGGERCFARTVFPGRRGSCFTARQRDPLTGGTIALRLCSLSRGHRLRLRVSRADLQCLTRDRAVVMVRSGDSCGAANCSLGSKDPQCAPETTTTTVAPSTSTSIATTSSTSSTTTTSTIGTTTTTTSSSSTSSTTPRPSTTTTTTTPPPTYICGIECTDHTGGLFNVLDLGTCQNATGALFDCGSSGEVGNVWVGTPFGHCGLRNRTFAGGSNGHWPRWVCAKCRNRDGFHRASGNENPIPAGVPCASHGRSIADSYCSQGTRGGLDRFYFGDCPS